VIAYGALLSEPSSRLTFPSLTNFRLVRVRNVRRLFGMTHLFLTGAGVVDVATRRIAALCVEPAEGCSFVAAAFDVVLDDAQREAFCARETGYAIVEAPFHGLDAGEEAPPAGLGVLCASSSDAELPSGVEPPAGLPHVWGWARDSGLLPADVYLRHCLLAMRKLGGVAERSFLHDTTLVDRRTTLSEYLAGGARERVMAVRPPESMAERFGG